MRLKTLANIGVILLVISIFAVQIGVADSRNGGSISGYKVGDDNGNGRWDRNEVGIKGWDIDLVGIVDTGYGYGHDTKIIREHTTTDKNGFYQFNDLSTGKYTITEEHNSKYKPTSPFIISRNLNYRQDSSGNNFFNQKIIPMSITVTSPNGGERWEQGSRESIKWKSVNMPSNEDVVIQVLKGNTVKAQWTQHNNGILSFTVTSKMFPIGNDYKVKITCTVGHSSMSDTSDNYFRIYK
jgi:hypothetical protein